MPGMVNRMLFYIRITWLYLTGKKPGVNGYGADYDIISATYESSWIRNMSRHTKELTDRIVFRNGYKMLDLGCGTGFIIREALKKALPASITGVDPSKGMLSQAKKIIKAGKVKFVQSGMMEFLKNIPDNTYDIVTSGWALPYVDAKNAVKQMARILKPGGQLAVISNRAGCVDTVVDSFLELMKEEPGKIRVIDDIQYKLIKNSAALKKLYQKNRIKWISGWDKEQSFYFPTGKIAMDWEKKCGSIAGSFKIMDMKDFAGPMAEILERKHKENGKIKITHRFCAGIGIK